MRLVPRGEWGMPGRLGPAKAGPFAGVDLHHTGGLDTDGPDPITDLAGAARFTDGKFGRVSYNAGLDIDDLGALLEMQGMHVGAHNDGENSTRFGLVVAGNFDRQPASDELVRAVAEAVVLVHSLGMTRTLDIKGHRDSDPTSCPGGDLYRRLPDIRRTIETIVTQEDTMSPEQEQRIDARLDKIVQHLENILDRASKTNAAAGRFEREHGPGGEDLSAGGGVDLDVLAAKVVDDLLGRLPRPD